MKKLILESLKYSLRSYPLIRSCIDEVDLLYNMDFSKLQRRNEDRFLHIFRKAMKHSKFYKNLYKNAGITLQDIQSVQDIKKLPVISREDINKNPNALLTTPVWKTIPARTSGTTGTSLKIYESVESILLEQAYLWVRRQKLGFKIGERLISLRGGLDRSTLKLKVPISNTLLLSSYNIRMDTTGLYYDEILKFKPKAIEGYPSSLYNLCCLLKDMGLKLEIPLCFTSSETLFEFQRELITEVLNTNVYDYYGCTERTIALSECMNHQGYYEDPGYSINEYNDDFVITTSLINDAFPLIRYKVNDSIELNEESSNQNTTCKIKKINGRMDHNIICKDGTVSCGFGWIFKNVSNVRLAQMIQKEAGKLQVNIVPENDFNEKDKQDVYNNCMKRFGKNNIDVNIDLITKDEIIYTSRNKYNMVLSYL